jgi:hypothetical protein
MDPLKQIYLFRKLDTNTRLYELLLEKLASYNSLTMQCQSNTSRVDEEVNFVQQLLWVLQNLTMSISLKWLDF